MLFSGCSQQTGDAMVIGKEQGAKWILQVEMRDGGRKISVPVDQARWEKTTPGETVIVSYTEARLTGTVWGAEVQ